MIALTNHEKKVFTLLIIFAAAFIYFKFLEGPEINNLSIKMHMLKKNKQELSTISGKQNEINMIESELQRQEKQTERLLNDSDSKAAISLLKQIIEISGCSIIRISVSEEKEMQNEYDTSISESSYKRDSANKIYIMPITCLIRGSYENIIKATEKIQSSAVLMSIEKIQLSNSNSKENDYSIVLDVNYYYIK